ncbi:CBS domain-containing protein [Mycolicibacterium sp.]|jgi:CBS domain-containing protein|uniref:CBS domain-containing protein n=1 Tax=Mycolicibacterium sp. TaxID=2320850 RepID=UPI001A3457A3|nr:CBS domain-containing protein [Mycolicibacterium sp.]MBJ7398717.1 CBS domain-containing protein [Mycolicibacterium sp.]
MRIADILRSKGPAVATVTETTTVAALLTELEVRNIGAMVVIGTGGQERSDSGNMGTGGVVGIVSERDVVRKLHEYGSELLGRSVGDIMSVDVLTCRPEDPIDDLAALMTNNRVRHVPVLDNGQLAGIVSIGDVVKIRMEELQSESQQLHAYITQGG